MKGHFHWRYASWSSRCSFNCFGEMVIWRWLCDPLIGAHGPPFESIAALFRRSVRSGMDQLYRHFLCNTAGRFEIYWAVA